MSLSSKSNTINALGVFGRLEKKQEDYFKSLQDKYSQFPKDAEDAIGIFNHLSIAIKQNAKVSELSKYIDLLKELKSFLPVKLKTNGVIAKDDQHLALTFDTKQTKSLRDIAKKFTPDSVVTTYYTKVVWFVPKDKQPKVEKILKNVQEMVFYDFKLCANRQEEESTIYSSLRF